MLSMLAAAAAATVLADAPTPAPVVAAERAFAADGLAYGVKRSFLAHSTPDAIIIEPTPANAHVGVSSLPDPKPGEPRNRLQWWPLWAGISRSGDLGFTTGPVHVNDKPVGHYFTVWRRQPDGGWKWVFDKGVGADPGGEAPSGSPAAHLPLATAQSGSPEAAMSEVRAAESDLAARAGADLTAAYLGYLADDARVHTEGPPPAKGPAAFAGVLSARAPAMHFKPLGGGASAAGDMAWTYGDARWSKDGKPGHGYYARVWQKRVEGWRIVFDELAPDRPAS